MTQLLLWLLNTQHAQLCVKLWMHTQLIRRAYVTSHTSRLMTTHPCWVFDEVAAAGALVDALGVDALIDGPLRLPDDLPELRILRELVPVRVAGRHASVSVQERLPLAAASGTPAGRRTTEPGVHPNPAPGTSRARRTVAEIIGIAKRRDSGLVSSMAERESGGKGGITRDKRLFVAVMKWCGSVQRIANKQVTWQPASGKRRGLCVIAMPLANQRFRSLFIFAYAHADWLELYHPYRSCDKAQHHWS